MRINEFTWRLIRDCCDEAQYISLRIRRNSNSFLFIIDNIMTCTHMEIRHYRAKYTPIPGIFVNAKESNYYINVKIVRDGYAYTELDFQNIHKVLHVARNFATLTQYRHQMLSELIEQTLYA